jgi:hypothetical protein
MRINLHTLFLTGLFILISFGINAQCKISQEITPTGIYNTLTEHELIYFNNKYTITAQVLFDGDDYFAVFIMKPFFSEKGKLGAIHIVLESKDTLELQFYDANKKSKDSTLNLFYKIEPSQFTLLKQYNINEIYTVFNEVKREFILKLHKDAIKNQLNCLLNQSKK